MSYYEKHVFICTNQRPPGKPCCNSRGGSEAKEYAKNRIDELKLHGKVRISSAGCLGRCAEGPLLVIYPEAIWYRYNGLDELELIIEEHLVHGRIVEHLKI